MRSLHSRGRLIGTRPYSFLKMVYGVTSREMLRRGVDVIEVTFANLSGVMLVTSGTSAAERPSRPVIYLAG